MPLTREQRLEYLQKARDAKKAKGETVINNKDISPEQKKKEPKKENKKKTLNLDLTKEIEIDAKREEQEKFINEVIKVKAPAKKRIIKRIIEVEEPTTDEEVQEEIVIKPAKAKENSKVPLKEKTEKSINIQPNDYNNNNNNNNNNNYNLYRDIFPD